MRARLRATVAVLLLGVTGCGTGLHTLSFPDPPSTVAPPPPPETLPPGLAAIAEAPVGGVTTTTAPALGPGPASLTGTVSGPNGPVAGATVEVDRFVGAAHATARTTTAQDGTWSFRSILGGDYRVRAWQAPALAMPSPQIVYLAADHPQSVALQLQSYQGQQVQVAINPGNPVQGQPANLVIQVTNPNVNADGILSAPPVAGTPVTLVDGPDWQVANGNPIVTDASGQATFQVVCTTVGVDSLSAQVGVNPPVSLQMPSCNVPPTTTTTTTGGAGFFPTSTTCPPPPTTPGETSTTLNFGQQC